jgi:hypothetical protein
METDKRRSEIPVRGMGEGLSQTEEEKSAINYCTNLRRCTNLQHLKDIADEQCRFVWAFLWIER